MAFRRLVALAVLLLTGACRSGSAPSASAVTDASATPAVSASASAPAVSAAPAPPPASAHASTPTPTGPPTQKPGGSGVDGSLVWDPPCRQSHPACMMPTRLLDGEVFARRNGATVAKTHTANYRFVLTLAPGAYSVTAKPDDPNYPTCTPVNVQVPPGQYRTISISCQSK